MELAVLKMKPTAWRWSRPNITFNLKQANIWMAKRN